MNVKIHFLRALVVGLICLTSSNQVLAVAWENGEGWVFENGDIAEVKRILTNDKNGYYSGEQLVRALEHTILYGQVELVKYLATRGWLEICRKTPNCHTVDWATGSMEMLQYLVSEGFPITVDALYHAAETGHLRALEFLCNQGADPNEKYKYSDKDFIHNRIAVHEITVLEMLKKSEAFNGEAQWSSENPLMDAQRLAAVVMATEFIEKGECRKGVRPSSLLAAYEQRINALRKSDLPLAKQLFSRRETDAIHPTIFTYLLYEAIASGSLEMLNYLKTIGWFDQCKKTKLCRPAEIAAQAGARDDLFELLLSAGFELDWSSSGYRETPLHLAVLGGHLEAVKFLCRHGADARQAVTIGITNDSLLTALRKSYGIAWCASNGQMNQEAEYACEDMLAIYAHDCVPGKTCRSVKFPPAGPHEAVQKLVGLSEVFRYLQSGSCNPLPEGQCHSVSPKDGTVVADSIRLREAPDQTSAIIETLKYGQELTIIDASKDCVKVGGKAEHWVKVRISWGPTFSEGWVFDAYLDYLPDKNL